MPEQLENAVRMSQSPEGSTANCDESVPKDGMSRPCMSQSPEGPTANCDKIEGSGGHPPWSNVSIPRRVDGQLRPERR